MSREVTIALAQHDCVLGDLEANLQTVERMMRDAAAKGADIVAFPELGTSGFQQAALGEKRFEIAQPVDGPAMQRIGKLAAELGIYVIVAIIEQSQVPGVLYNTMVLIDRKGKVIGKYSKNHAYCTEEQYFASGREMPTFETDFGRIGIMICYDMGLPETARMLTLGGAEIIFVPSAWCQEDEDVWDINTACRALENRCFLAAVNRFGEEPGFTMFGKSKIVGPRGETRAEAKRFEEDLLVYTVDLAEIAPARDEIPYLRSRRPWSYGLLTDTSI